MKTLEELGISPTPWSVDLHTVVANDGCQLIDYDLAFYREEDAELVSASPEMYECLREAVLLKCSGCASDAGDKCLWQGECFAKKWRAALEKAGGAE